jgi:hypothetical protein
MPKPVRDPEKARRAKDFVDVCPEDVFTAYTPNASA